MIVPGVLDQRLETDRTAARVQDLNDVFLRTIHLPLTFRLAASTDDRIKTVVNDDGNLFLIAFPLHDLCHNEDGTMFPASSAALGLRNADDTARLQTADDDQFGSFHQRGVLVKHPKPAEGRRGERQGDNDHTQGKAQVFHRELLSRLPCNLS